MSVAMEILPENLERLCAETDSEVGELVAKQQLEAKSPGIFRFRSTNIAVAARAASHKSLCGGKLSNKPSTLETELANLTTWGNFNIFAVRDLCKGRPLHFISLALLDKFNLVEKLDLPRDKLSLYFENLEQLYNNNPYHNSTHAADVAQTVGVMLANDEDFFQQLSDLEVFSLLFSAIIHDTGHPGLTNQFLVRTRSPAAITYNDTHVNENSHLAEAFRLLLRPELNFLTHLSPDQWLSFRRTVIDVVIATDMAGHSALLCDYQQLLQKQGIALSKWSEAQRTKLLELIVHVADISNPLKPVRLSVSWANSVMEESWNQGDQEQKLGLSISPLCDRRSTNLPRTQIAFLTGFAQPSLELLRVFIPNTVAAAIYCGELTRSFWENIECAELAGRKAPCGDGPEAGDAGVTASVAKD